MLHDTLTGRAGSRRDQGHVQTNILPSIERFPTVDQRHADRDEALFVFGFHLVYFWARSRLAIKVHFGFLRTRTCVVQADSLLSIQVPMPRNGVTTQNGHIQCIAF